MIISQAVERLNQIDPVRYPITKQTSDTLRQACRRGKVEGAAKTLTGRWVIPEFGLLKWARNPDMHKPGPKPGDATK
jgi:hypothetical protein